MKRRILSICFIVVFCAGLIFTGKGAYMFIKAKAAQIRLEYSWNRLVNGHTIKPWPWADFLPMARLIFPTYNYTTIVVNSANGTSLAFAPGHLDGSAEPGSEGNCVIFGHRETHFNILQHVKIGDTIILCLDNGKNVEYKITSINITDKTSTGVVDQVDETQVTLITCYPFTAILPGDKRFVVIAKSQA